MFCIFSPLWNSKKLIATPLQTVTKEKKIHTQLSMLKPQGSKIQRQKRHQVSIIIRLKTNKKKKANTSNLSVK